MKKYFKDESGVVPFLAVLYFAALATGIAAGVLSIDKPVDLGKYLNGEAVYQVNK